MAFDPKNLTAANFDSDTSTGSGALTIHDKREKVVGSIQLHIDCYLYGKPQTKKQAKKDEKGVIMKDENGSRIMESVPYSPSRFSKPHKADKNAVVAKLRYGKSFIEIGGNEANKLDAKQEEDFWKWVIEGIKKGDYDNEIEKASKASALQNV